MILETIDSHCKDNGYISNDVCCLCFDGLMLETSKFNPKLPQIFNILILEKFGLDLKFDEKKMDNYLDILDDHLKEDIEDTESEFGEDYLNELSEINNEWQDNEYRDARLLLSCLNKESIGILKNWRDIGIFLFSLTTDKDESYLKLWLDLAERSCKFTSEH